MRIIDRNLLKDFLSRSSSNTVCEAAVHTLFMLYGFDNEENKEGIKNEEE